MANQTCSKKPLKLYAPPFYSSRFNHHHASRTNCTNKCFVHFPVATGPRNCVVPNRKPKDKPRFNKGAKRLFIKKQHHRESWLLFKSKKIAQVVSAWIKSKNSLVKHFEDMRLCRPSKEYLQVKLVSMVDDEGRCKVMLVNALRRFRESLRRVTDGAEAFLILTLFILCLDKVSTDHAKLVPLGKVCTAKETLEKNTAKGKVTPLFDTMLVQPTQGEGASSETLSDEQPSPSPTPTGEVPNESLPDSSSAQPNQARKLNPLKANQQSQERKQTCHQRSQRISEECLIAAKIPRKSFSKKHRVHKESKLITSWETENSSSEGRDKEMEDEDMSFDEVDTDESKVSTDEQVEGTEESNEKIKQESKDEVKEEDKGEENTRKRKHGTRKKIKSRKRRFKQDTSQDDPSDIEKENYELRDYGFNFMNTKIYIDNESTICIVKNPVYHSKTKHIAIRHHFIRDAYEKKLIQVLKIHTNDNVADLLTKAFDGGIMTESSVDDRGDGVYLCFNVVWIYKSILDLRRIRESLIRVTNGTEPCLTLTLFILCLDKVSTDHVKSPKPIRIHFNRPITHAISSTDILNLQALISLTDDLSLRSNMAALESCPKHNMIANLEKTEGNVEFHEVIDFLQRSYISHALTVSPVVSTTFVEQFWTSAKSKTINNARHITAKLVSITEASIRTDLLFDDADGIDTLPNQAIFDAIQLMGYEGDLTVLTFNKALFSPQWRFLFHTINHCLSSKSTSWDQIPTNVATAVICLTTNQKYNFSKLIFDGMIRHLEAKKKFVMYPRFISIFLAKQLVNVTVPLDHFPVNSLTSKVFSFMVKKGKHFSGKITPLFDNMLVQPTQKEGTSSERLSEAHPTPSPEPTSEAPNESMNDSSSAQSSEVPFEQQPDLSPSPSPRPSPNPSPTPNIPDSIPEHTGENLGDHSFNDTSLSGNEDAMTLQNVYDLCISLCKQVSDQAKEIKLLKAKITKLKKKANPVIKHFKAYQKRISKEQRQQRKHLSKKKKVQIDIVSKQGRKNAKGDGKAEENAQSEGRTKEMMDEDKETDEVGLSTEDEVSTAKKGVSTDFEKVSTDRPKLSTDDLKVSTDEQMESNDDQVDASEEIFKGTEDQKESTEKLQEQEREQFTIEERAKFLHDTIAAQRKFLAQQRSQAIRNKPPTKNQLRNQMMTYIKHVGNYKHANLKSKKFEDIQALYENIKRFNEHFISTGSAKDESTDEQMESNDDQVDASEEIFEGTEDQREGIEEKVESTAEQKVSTEEQSKEEIASQASQTSSLTPTSVIFGDDETIATLLINMSKAKAISKEKEKGVELKDVEDTDRPRTTSTRSTLTLKPLPKIDPKDKGKKKIEEEDETESEDDDIPQAVKKFKQLESDEELARKVQEEWEAEEEKNKIAEEEATNEALIKNFDDVKARIEADRILAEKLQEQEREQFTIEERAKFLHDTIAAQRKFLAQQRSQAIRNKPPTKNQLRNQMITYIKHVGNYKHADLKSKKFEHIQALYEKIKRFNEDFISTRSAQDERFIKRMNEKGAGLSKSEVIKEETKGEVKIEDKEEESTRKRKLGTRKKMKSRKRRYIQHTSEDDSDKENDELRLCLKIAQDEEKEVDYEVLDRKYPIIDWKTVCLGTKPQFDESKEGEINLNVVTRSNGQQRYFSVLTTVLSIFDREDLNAVYQLVMDKYHDEMPEGFERVLWGDLKVLFKPDEQDEFWSSQHEWKVISWKLHSSSGVHTLMTNEGVVIHMLTEKKYPLKKEIVVQMLNLKLESEEESTMALELIRFIKKVLADLESKEQD
ncbi:hypothetical protein Tco_0184602 [Tanacetum coccineum]